MGRLILIKIFLEIFCELNNLCIFATSNAGTLAQSVEQRTENPCVPGSIPGGTTKKTSQ